MLFPAYLRFLVRYNASRRSLLQLYMVLETESFSEDHPLHDYFENRPKYVWEHYSQYTWKLPPEIGGWENMRAIVRQSLEAMDGIQLRWMRRLEVCLREACSSGWKDLLAGIAFCVDCGDWLVLVKGKRCI